MIRVALITVSTSRAATNDQNSARVPIPEADVSGERLVVLAGALDAEVVGREIVPDDRELIARRLVHWADGGEANLILTSGGTGFAPSDQTPEATRSVIERSAPGIPEAIRLAASGHTDKWPLSRAEAGIRGSCLIINLPGSPKSIDQSGPALIPFMRHAIDLIEDVDCSH